MKTLIISGSPRKNGDSMVIVNEIIKYLDGEKHIIYTYDGKIEPCTDCRYCFSHNKCCINDDMQKIYEFLDQADNVIMASPLYFSELTGQLLNFASRLQLFYAAKYVRKDIDFKLKEKNGILVISAGGATKDFERSAKTANIIFKEMNTNMIGIVRARNTDKIPAKEDHTALKQAKLLALKLNDLFPKS